jgi:hypothetical protein
MATNFSSLLSSPCSSPITLESPPFNGLTIRDLATVVQAWDFNKPSIDQDDTTLNMATQILFENPPSHSNTLERSQKLYIELQYRLQQYLLLIGFVITF